MKEFSRGINMIMALICVATLILVACGDEDNDSKKAVVKVSKAERIQIRLQITDLQERMQVVMETQSCIVQNCSSNYADVARKSVIQVNTRVVQAQGDIILPTRLKQLAIRVDGIEEIHVDLLKRNCTICAK